MNDVFAILVTRAWDLAPRARPQLAPRFAPRTEPLRVEEAERVSEAPAAVGSHDPAPATSPLVSSCGEMHSEIASAEPRPAVARSELHEPAERHAPAVSRALDVAPAAIERSVERVIETPMPVERLHVAHTSVPVAMPHAHLNTVDIERFRPAQPTARQPERTPPASSAMPSLARHASVEAAPVEPVEIFIGRIDVRASALAPPAPATRARTSHAPLSLNEYLNRKRDDR
jgi:hypothetical protein